MFNTLLFLSHQSQRAEILRECSPHTPTQKCKALALKFTFKTTTCRVGYSGTVKCTFERYRRCTIAICHNTSLLRNWWVSLDEQIFIKLGKFQTQINYHQDIRIRPESCHIFSHNKAALLGFKLVNYAPPFQLSKVTFQSFNKFACLRL